MTAWQNADPAWRIIRRPGYRGGWRYYVQRYRRAWWLLWLGKAWQYEEDCNYAGCVRYSADTECQARVFMRDRQRFYSLRAEVIDP